MYLQLHNEGGWQSVHLTDEGTIVASKKRACETASANELAELTAPGYHTDTTK